MGGTLSDKEYVQINQAIFSLRNAYESRLRGEGEEAMAGLGIGELGVLMVIGQAEGITAQELAAKMDLTKGTISIHVGALVEGGHVVQTRSGQDRRRWLLNLTDAGRRLYRDAFRGTVRYTQDILAPLDGAERKTFHELVTKLARGNGYDWQ